MKIAINYLYFGAMFLLIVLLSTSSILLKENLIGSRFFFLFYAIGQALLEVLFLAFLAFLIERTLGKKAFWIFIGCTFVFWILHLFDFMMDRVLDLSVWRALDIFVFSESFSNFLYLLDASGIPMMGWLFFFVLLAAIPFLGIGIYKLLNRKPANLQLEIYLQLFVCTFIALFFWDYSASKVISPDAYTAFEKSLPWKRTFLQPDTVHLALKASLKVPDIQITPPLSLEKKPNIILFIVESLREDFLTPDIAPHLSSFREKTTHADLTLSNANGTNLSWFSIFYSQPSFHWKTLNGGSPALKLFKDLGYTIRVYTAAQLGYYGLEETIFGKDKHLIDVYQEFHHSAGKEAWESDRDAVHALNKDLQISQGQLFIVFLDGTHFDYSFPKPAPFSPFASDALYFKAFYSQKNFSAIKNRYRNAVHYMDSLFGEFLGAVPADSIIAFTGDHGEEFFRTRAPLP